MFIHHEWVAASTLSPAPILPESDHATRAKGSALQVLVCPSTESIDFDKWARRYVEAIMSGYHSDTINRTEAA